MCWGHTCINVLKDNYIYVCKRTLINICYFITGKNMINKSLGIMQERNPTPVTFFIDPSLVHPISNVT